MLFMILPKQAWRHAECAAGQKERPWLMIAQPIMVKSRFYWGSEAAFPYTFMAES